MGSLFSSMDVLARLADLGQYIPPREQQTPEALRAYQKAEIEKWWPIIKAAGIKAEWDNVRLGWQRVPPKTQESIR
jgi:hypothetical protein